MCSQQPVLFLANAAFVVAGVGGGGGGGEGSSVRRCFPVRGFTLQSHDWSREEREERGKKKKRKKKQPL